MIIHCSNPLILTSLTSLVLIFRSWLPCKQSHRMGRYTPRKDATNFTNSSACCSKGLQPVWKHFQIGGDSTSPSSQSRVNSSFKGHLGDVLYYGCCLKYIVDGSALDHYLYNLKIEQLLADHHRDTVLHADSSRNYDPDLHRPTASKLNSQLVPCWKSYKQWLFLMLIYFETIIVYVMGKLAF